MLRIKQLQKKIPNLEAAFVVSGGGNMLDYDVTESFLDENNYQSVKYLRNIVSLRFRIGDFDKFFGGLEATINKFKDKVLVSKSLSNSKIMILILPKNANLEKISQALHSL